MDQQKPMRFIELVYQFDVGIGWIPKSWKDEFSTLLNYSCDIKVERYEINPEVSDEVFEPKPVYGAVVRDYTEHTYYIDRGKEKRTIRPGEWKGGTNYEELLNSEEEKRSPVLVVVLLLLAVATIVVLMTRVRGKSLRKRQGTE
jgi:hypothetical protein